MRARPTTAVQACAGTHDSQHMASVKAPLAPEDCRGSGSCCNSLSKCYVKNDFWAGCNTTCNGVDAVGDPWHCGLWVDLAVLPMLPRDFLGFECDEGYLNWQAGWSEVKKVWCCSHRGKGCPMSPRSPFDCDDGLVQFQTAWTTEKQSWCCRKARKGCRSDVQPAGPAVNSPALDPPPSPTNCMWEGEDCSKSKCCKRSGYKCFKKNEWWSSCSDDCSRLVKAGDPWSCDVLGGDQGAIVLKRNSDKPAGTSLFCFSILTPVDIKETMNYQEREKVGIAACDAYAVYHGSRASDTTNGQSVDIAVSAQMWRRVLDEGEYKHYDWTVRADVDTVFIPSRLREHLKALKPPADSPLYLHTIHFMHHFTNGLEILSTSAVDAFMGNLADCLKHMGEKGPEDYFTMQCLDASRVAHMTDYSILEDKYKNGGSVNLLDIDPCADESVAAFHPYTSLGTWRACHEVASKKRALKDLVGCEHSLQGACSATLGGNRSAQLT